MPYLGTEGGAALCSGSSGSVTACYLPLWFLQTESSTPAIRKQRQDSRLGSGNHTAPLGPPSKAQGESKSGQGVLGGLAGGEGVALHPVPWLAVSASLMLQVWGGTGRRCKSALHKASFCKALQEQNRAQPDMPSNGLPHAGPPEVAGQDRSTHSLHEVPHTPHLPPGPCVSKPGMNGPGTHGSTGKWGCTGEWAGGRLQTGSSASAFLGSRATHSGRGRARLEAQPCPPHPPCQYEAGPCKAPRSCPGTFPQPPQLPGGRWVRV